MADNDFPIANTNQNGGNALAISNPEAGSSSELNAESMQVQDSAVDNENAKNDDKEESHKTTGSK